MGYTKWHVGQKIGDRWTVESLLEGGFGVVYFVTDDVTQRQLVMKTLRPELMVYPRARARFLHECVLWIDMEPHPCVLQAVSLRKFDGQPYLFTYRMAQSLKELIRSRDYNYFTIAYICSRICAAMSFLGRSGFAVHGDLHPGNILLDTYPYLRTVKLCDLGLARTVADSESYPCVTEETSESPGARHGRGSIRRLVHVLRRLRREPEIEVELPNVEKFSRLWATRLLDLSFALKGVGCLPYMAPEQFNGYQDLRSDIYSFGIVLYEMLTGQPPYVGHSLQEYKALHQNAYFPNPRVLFPVPPGFITLVDRCLAKEPNNRFQNFNQIRDFIADLCPRDALSELEEHQETPSLDCRDAAERAASLAKIKDWKRSRRWCMRALDPKFRFCNLPMSAPVWHLTSRVFAELGEWSQAEEAISQANRLDPKGDIRSGDSELLDGIV